jgi:hypothetical protein
MAMPLNSIGNPWQSPGASRRTLMRMLSPVLSMLTGLLALTGPTRAQTRPLSAISTPIAHVEHYSISDYVWLKDDEIVWWSADRSPTVVRTVPGSDVGLPDAHLNRMISAWAAEFLNPASGAFLSRLVPSPDAKLLLLVETHRSSGIAAWHVRSIDGPAASGADAVERTVPVWDSGSTTLLTFGTETSGAGIYRWPVKHGGVLGDVVRIGDWRPRAAYASDYPELLGITKGGDGILIHWHQHTGEDIMVYDVDAGHGVRKTRKFIIHPPGKGRVFDLALSPVGDRLAWNVYVPSTRSASAHNRQQSVIGLYVSQIDGTGMGLVGDMPVRTINQFEGFGPFAPNLIHWTPDGKQISYMLGDSIYVVPVGKNPAGK